MTNLSLQNVASFTSKLNSNFRKVVRTIQQTKMFFEGENVHCTYIEEFVSHSEFVFFCQAHRDEVITMVANPVVDQVISAGLGESNVFVLSTTSKMFIIKKYKSYLLHARYIIQLTARALTVCLRQNHHQSFSL